MIRFYAALIVMIVIVAAPFITLIYRASIVDEKAHAPEKKLSQPQ